MSKFKRRPLEKLHQLEHALEPKAKEVKQSICSFSFFVAAVKTFCLVVFFYTFSIGLTFYNQRFIRVRLLSPTEWWYTIHIIYICIIYELSLSAFNDIYWTQCHRKFFKLKYSIPIKTFQDIRYFNFKGAERTTLIEQWLSSQ